MKYVTIIKFRLKSKWIFLGNSFSNNALALRILPTEFNTTGYWFRREEKWIRFNWYRNTWTRFNQMFISYEFIKTNCLFTRSNEIIINISIHSNSSSTFISYSYSNGKTFINICKSSILSIEIPFHFVYFYLIDFRRTTIDGFYHSRISTANCSIEW